jgi:hypothetical protein
MKPQWSLLTLVLPGALAFAAEPPPAPLAPAAPGFAPGDVAGACPTLFAADAPGAAPGGPLAGNHDFPRFIDFISNPLQNIDPRAVTAIYPLFGSAWFSSAPALPDGDMQVYGPAITVALSDRLAVGLNQGGYAAIQLSGTQRARILNDPRLAALAADRRDRLRDIASGGERDGFLNLGGFAQYTLIEDVPDQFLLTGGVRLEVPCGSHEVFQGYGPAHMAPYLTAGKEYGQFHVLATTGYMFPLGPSSDNTQLFYADLHLDRRCFGWLYPLVELNCIYHTTSVSFGLTTRRGFVDFDNFESSGNILTLSAGANAVLIPERLEFGAVYTTNIATQGNFGLDGVLVKMVLRY